MGAVQAWWGTSIRCRAIDLFNRRYEPDEPARKAGRKKPPGDIWRGGERPRPGGSITGPRVHLGTLPSILRALDTGRLAGNPLQRPAVLGLWEDREVVSGGQVETPAGRLDLPSFPASAAGPDLKEIVLGSEGRLGIVTHATLRVSLLPQREDFHAVFFPDFEHGMQAARQILWAGIPLSMLRLSTPMETITTLALAGHERLIGALERLLAVRGLTAKMHAADGFHGAGCPGKNRP